MSYRSQNIDRAEPSVISSAAVLLQPWWWSALLVLLLNDHLFKGAVLPAELQPQLSFFQFLTGKLSDFAGLLLAPALLAALLRLRSRRALLLVHLAIAFVFAAIQLSIPFANLWSSAMGVIALPWKITSDPSDLIALPVLVLSWRWIVSQEELAPLRNRFRRWGREGLQYMAASIGLFASVATSPDYEDDFDSFFSFFYLHNSSDAEIRFTVRPLRDDVKIDCLELAKDPNKRLNEQLFARFDDSDEDPRILQWELPTQMNAPLLDERSPEEECVAVLVSGDQFPPFVVFAESEQLQEQWVDGQHASVDELSPRNGVAPIFDTDGQFSHFEGGEGFVYPLDSRQPERPESCKAPEDENRLEWTPNWPSGIQRIDAIRFGIDGCHELKLLSEDEKSHSGIVCMPQSLFPFAEGESIVIHESQGSDGVIQGPYQSLRMQRMVAGESESDESLPLAPVMLLSRGRGLPDLGQSMSVESLPDCGLYQEELCATASLSARLRVGREGASVEVGESFGFEVEGDLELEGQLVHAESRVYLEDECSLGSDELGFDLEVAAVYHPADESPQE